MTDKITHISKVIIKKLWGYPDLNFEWKLNPDVNVLAGDNGSGKSTILKFIIANISEFFRKERKILAEEVKIYFNDNTCISYHPIKGTVQELEEKVDKNEYIRIFMAEFEKQGRKNFDSSQNIDGGLFLIKKNEVIVKPPIDLLMLSIIDTFDQDLKEKESVQKLSNDKVKTELDWQIYQLQEQYKDYQINIGKRANEILRRAIKDGTDGLAKAEQEVDKKKNIFLDTIDDLFKITQKRIDREKNEISFIQREKDISPYQLSSGEKQILLILLNALVQDNKHSVMIMDEPEISLHTDWQESLIDNIRKLNENAQIIIATHSPFIISKGWASEKYVFQMDKIKLR